MQEMLKDLFYRVGYKKDYFIKGKTKLDSLQAEKELLKLSFIYGSKEISYKWKWVKLSQCTSMSMSLFLKR